MVSIRCLLTSNIGLKRAQLEREEQEKQQQQQQGTPTNYYSGSSPSPGCMPCPPQLGHASFGMIPNEQNLLSPEILDYPSAFDDLIAQCTPPLSHVSDCDPSMFPVANFALPPPCSSVPTSTTPLSFHSSHLSDDFMLSPELEPHLFMENVLPPGPPPIEAQGPANMRSSPPTSAPTSAPMRPQIPRAPLTPDHTPFDLPAKPNSVSSSAWEACNGKMGLHLSAERGNAHIVQLLLAHGAEIDALDWCGRTALHYAVRNSHLDVVMKLLERGAETDIQDCDGLSPLHVAAEVGAEETIRLLIQEGANLNARIE